MATNRARDAYIYQRAAALHTLSELESIIENMPTHGSDDQVNWGHVGTMSEINNKLCDLLRFATGN
ncbi:MAG: hypothetical protein ACO376_05415 [Gammaproteobacteria bacterium]